MANSIQIKRGATEKVAAYTPLIGELVLDTTTNKLFVGDGSTVGGNNIVASRKGVANGSDATSGNIGEYISSSVASVSIPASGTASNITSLTLSAGDWEVQGTIHFSDVTGGFSWYALLTTTSGGGVGTTTLDRITTLNTAATNYGQRMSTPVSRFNVSASTTIYLTGQCNFSSGTLTADAVLRARRIN